MKTLFVKQSLDHHGPWSSFKYAKGKEDKILKLFKTKIYMFETILALEADVAIIPTTDIHHKTTPWLQSHLKNIPDYGLCMKQHTHGIIDEGKIDFGKYDLVISNDPCLVMIEELQKVYPNTVFAYILAEHTSFQVQQRNAVHYDLMLDHLLTSTYDVEIQKERSIDHSLAEYELGGNEHLKFFYDMLEVYYRKDSSSRNINFILMRDREKIQNLFPCKVKDSIYFDFRSLSRFLGDKVNDISEVNKVIDKVKEKLPDYEIIHNAGHASKPYLFHNPPVDDEPKEYYESIARSKYFVSIDGRVGQAIGESCSLGCISLGSKISPTHKVALHEKTLFDTIPTSIDEVVDLIVEIESDEELQSKILKHQNEMIDYHFNKQIKDMFAKAIKIKRNQGE